MGAILRFVAGAVARWIMGQVLLWAVLYGASVFATEIREFVARLFERVNNALVVVLDLTLNAWWRTVSTLQASALSVVTGIRDAFESATGINLDWVLKLPEIAARIDESVRAILDTIAAALSVWLGAILNPIHDEVTRIAANLEALKGDIDAAWSEAIAPVRQLWADVDALIALGAVEVGQYAADQLRPGQIVSAEFVEQHREAVRLKAQEVSLVNLGRLTEPDWHTPAFATDRLQAYADDLRQAGDAIGGVVEAAQNWLLVTMATRVRQDLELWLSQTWPIMWARAFDKWRNDVSARLDNYEASIQQAATDAKESAREELRKVKESIQSAEATILESINEQELEGLWRKSVDSVLDHQAEIDEKIKQINIAEFVEDAGDVDGILIQLPRMKHQTGPAYGEPEELRLADIYRMSVNYLSRSERLALMIVIAEQDLTIDARGMYDKLWQGREQP
ncbi:MAG: hypothetical protein H6926_04045 [Chromatiales bacterium]|nr:hypothetical protein [Gammaproteobacteria bacterium]MCP5352346.1 hypothetical protein [Chromatiales bacterium]